MNTYLISYDLRAPGRNYQPVWDYLGKFTSVKPLESLYIVQTSKNAATIRDELMNLIDSNDQILVIAVSTTNWASYKLPVTSAWLNSH